MNPTFGQNRWLNDHGNKVQNCWKFAKKRILSASLYCGIDAALKNLNKMKMASPI